MKKLIMIALTMLLITSCSENYSNGERIGSVTQFSETGLIWKSWEGHLNTTQSGMNSSVPFDFSIDNDSPDQTVINSIDSAAQFGWKVKLVYHQTRGWNWFSNRGETSHFITKVEVLDKNFANPFSDKQKDTSTSKSRCDCSNRVSGGTVIDTIYVIIDKSK